MISNLDKINEISVYLQIAIIAGIIFRIIYCFIALQTCEEEANKYKKRIKNSLIFLVISQLAFVIKDLILRYYN